MDILETIAADLGIKQGNHETENDFRDRVVLSALSKWMLTACFNGEEGSSVESIKAVAAEKLSFFRDAFSMGSTSLIDSEKYGQLNQYIYRTLLENGAFYHRALYVSPKEHSMIPFGSSALLSGLLPGERCSFSGLAPFAAGNGAIADICDEFDLPSDEMDTIVSMMWKRSVPVNNNVEIAEYLKFDQIRNEYYSPQKNRPFSITMGRINHLGAGYEQYIVKDSEIRRIPDDYIADDWDEYCALAIINKYTQQIVTAIHDVSLLHLSFSCRLPRKDLRFMRYVAWPKSLSKLNGTCDFTISRQLWPVVRERLVHLNYKVEEK